MMTNQRPPRAVLRVQTPHGLVCMDYQPGGLFSVGQHQFESSSVSRVNIDYVVVAEQRRVLEAIVKEMARKRDRHLRKTDYRAWKKAKLEKITENR